jgi:hypothetical protein
MTGSPMSRSATSGRKDDEHALGSGARCVPGERNRRRFERTKGKRHAGQLDDELAPLADAIASRLNRAAVQGNEALHDRQTEAEATLRVLERLRLLKERLEDVDWSSPGLE